MLRRQDEELAVQFMKEGLLASMPISRKSTNATRAVSNRASRAITQDACISVLPPMITISDV